MLPPFSDTGDLPPGIHRATLKEIQRRFGSGSTTRVRVFGVLEHLHELAQRTGQLRNFYLFGSFVSSIPEPRDVDVLLVMAADFTVERCPRESRKIFSHADAEASYGASVFWLCDGMLSKDEMRDLMAVWQTKRDGAVRGILEVA